MFVPSSCTTDTLYSILASVGPPRPPCIFGSVFTMAHWAVVRPQHTEWTRDWASYRTRTRGGDQWSSGGQNITTNSGQCGEIIMIRFICALSSVLWAPCPISPHYEGHYHAAPATICSLSDWNYLYKVRLATENNNLDVDIVDRMRVGCEYGNVCGCWLWWWLHCTIMIIARQGCARMTFSW